MGKTVSIGEMIEACETAGRIPPNRGGVRMTAAEKQQLADMRALHDAGIDLSEREKLTLRQLYADT